MLGVLQWTVAMETLPLHVNWSLAYSLKARKLSLPVYLLSATIAMACKLDVVGCILQDLISAIAKESNLFYSTDPSVLTELLTILSDKGLISSLYTTLNPAGFLWKQRSCWMVLTEHCLLPVISRSTEIPKLQCYMLSEVIWSLWLNETRKKRRSPVEWEGVVGRLVYCSTEGSTGWQKSRDMRKLRSISCLYCRNTLRRLEVGTMPVCYLSVGIILRSLNLAFSFHTGFSAFKLANWIKCFRN